MYHILQTNPACTISLSHGLTNIRFDPVVGSCEFQLLSLAQKALRLVVTPFAFDKSLFLFFFPPETCISKTEFGQHK